MMRGTRNFTVEFSGQSPWTRHSENDLIPTLSPNNVSVGDNNKSMPHRKVSHV